LLVIVITTYLGLLAVTFFIGRVIPIDPALAIAGDRAPTHMWWSVVRREMGISTSRSITSSSTYYLLKGVAAAAISAHRC
jgi:peptide/nickel transport system permease protein